MNNLLKNTAKFAIGTCFTLGAVAVAATVVAGSNIGKIVSAGFKGAKNAVEEELAALKANAASADESAVFADVEKNPIEEVETSPADFEN